MPVHGVEALGAEDEMTPLAGQSPGALGLKLCCPKKSVDRLETQA
jgi:hypothetical protein